MYYGEPTVNGVPLSQLTRPAAPDDPNTNMPGDREFVRLLRRGEFPEAMRLFPSLYSNAHIGFLSRLTGQPVPVDDRGAIPPLSETEFLAAIAYIEGPTKLR